MQLRDGADGATVEVVGIAAATASEPVMAATARDEGP